VFASFISFRQAPSRNSNHAVPNANIGTKDHTQRVPRSQRGGEVIEPMVSAQWFVRTQGERCKLCVLWCPVVCCTAEYVL
jgi:hypothetical protein